MDKQPGDLAGLIDRADRMSAAEITELGRLSTQRIRNAYSWQHIADEYEQVFTSNSMEQHQ